MDAVAVEDYTVALFQRFWSVGYDSFNIEALNRDPRWAALLKVMESRKKSRRKSSAASTGSGQEGTSSGGHRRRRSSKSSKSSRNGAGKQPAQTNGSKTGAPEAPGGNGSGSGGDSSKDSAFPFMQPLINWLPWRKDSLGSAASDKGKAPRARSSSKGSDRGHKHRGSEDGGGGGGKHGQAGDPRVVVDYEVVRQIEQRAGILLNSMIDKLDEDAVVRTLNDYNQDRWRSLSPDTSRYLARRVAYRCAQYAEARAEWLVNKVARVLKDDLDKRVRVRGMLLSFYLPRHVFKRSWFEQRLAFGRAGPVPMLQTLVARFIADRRIGVTAGAVTEKAAEQILSWTVPAVTSNGAFVDLMSGEVVQSLGGRWNQHGHGAAMCVAGSGRFFITVDADKQRDLLVFPAVGGLVEPYEFEMHRLTGHRPNIDDVIAVDAHGRFASCSWDKSVRVWDAATGKQVHVWQHAAGFVHQLALLGREQRHLAACSSDGNTYVYSLDELDAAPMILTPPRVNQAIEPRATCCAATPNREFLAVGYDDCRVLVWRTTGDRAGQVAFSIRTPSEVEAVTVHGTKLLAVCNRTLLGWNIEQRMETALAPPPDPAEVAAAAAAASGGDAGAGGSDAGQGNNANAGAAAGGGGGDGNNGGDAAGNAGEDDNDDDDDDHAIAGAQPNAENQQAEQDAFVAIASPFFGLPIRFVHLNASLVGVSCAQFWRVIDAPCLLEITRVKSFGDVCVLRHPFARYLEARY